MFGKVLSRHALAIVSALLLTSAAARASTISIVGKSISVSAKDKNGVSFQYDGTIKPADVVSFSVSGVAYMQGGPALGTNAAGIIVTAGAFPNETAGGVSDVLGTKIALGSLLLEVNGFGPVVFHPTPVNGLGSPDAPQTLVFTGSLSQLFGSFTPIKDPTITLLVADESWMYGDNTGGYTVTDLSSPASVPVPAAVGQTLTGLAIVGAIVARRRLTGA